MPSQKPAWDTLSKNRLESAIADGKPRYSDSEAAIEANRCLFCYDAPCIQACPTAIDIPSFIKKIATGNIKGSAKTIFRANMLGTSCSRVCPVEVLCAGACVYNDLNHLPIQIGRLQRYATEQALEEEATSGNKLFKAKPGIGKKVALIGAGPASLACAAHLALEGVEAVIFERDELPGGLNTTGVAPYKFHAEDALAEVQWILSHGVTLKTGVTVGSDISFAALRRDYDAVFVGVGLGKDRHLGLGDGALGATALIRAIKNDPQFRLPHGLTTAVVVGGGNTAIDIARELAMLSVPKVQMLYRRSEADMSGYVHEMVGARQAGVQLVEHVQPQKLRHENGVVVGVEAKSTATGESLFFPCQMVVEAIGQEKWASALGEVLPLNDNGTVAVDETTRQTILDGVYAGGDCINGGKEVVNAAEDGREAAFAMLRSWGLAPSVT